MNLRFRILITAACLCHLLFTVPIVTSQLHPGASLEFPSVAGLQPPPLHLQLQPPTAACSGTITHVHSPGQALETIIQACEQERTGGIYKANGNVLLTHGNYLLYGDHITYDPKTGDTTETGHVILDGGPHDEHLEATHGTYNVRTQVGTFYNVSGTLGMRFHGQLVTLTTSNPFAFTGKVVDKLGPDRYVVHHGTITSCEVPHPIWTFNMPRAVVEVGGDAKIYHTTFRVKGVPAFFLPYATHPAERLGRHSGFLMPNFGTSNIKGILLGDSFFWAINRSMDATVGTEMYSTRGWAERGDFRATPNDHSFFVANYSGVTDRGFQLRKGQIGACSQQIGTTCKQGGEDITAKGADDVSPNLRVVLNLEYLSSYVYRLAFNTTYVQAINSEVNSYAFASKSTNGYFLNGYLGRYQDYQNFITNNVITIRHTPSFEFASVDRPLGKSPLYWSVDSGVDGLSRKEPTATTAAGATNFFRTAPEVGRFNLRPDVSLPVQFHDWDLVPEIALQDTGYTQSLIPVPGTVGVANGLAINRKALEAAFEVRPPSLSRVFEKTLFGYKLKHVIEPDVTYRYVTGVDNFSNILRFDEVDILTDTNEVEYGITNRIYAKQTKVTNPECELPPAQPESGQPTSTNPAPAAPSETGAYGAPPSGTSTPASGPGGPAAEEAASDQCQPPPAREVITWRVAQKRYFNPTFGGALVPGQSNVFTSTVDFTGIAFLTEPTNYSPVISRFRFQNGGMDAEWDLDYDLQKGRINASTSVLGWSIGQFYLAGGHSFLQGPGQLLPSSNTLSLPPKFNQWRILGRYGNVNRHGFSVAAGAGVDANLNTLQYSTYQANYNFNCCGLTFELQRFALGLVRNENQYRFAFSLANVGTFGNLRRVQRLF
ncbi:MAG TPA: LPS assembly protein LptD [Terriglobales bacterium]|nr:LPS assembly protein LptD [Terriglobales bacterium]